LISRGARAAAAALLMWTSTIGLESACVSHHNTTPPAVPSPPSRSASSDETRARTLVADLARHDWTHAEVPFDETMASALTPSMLSTLWGSLEAAGGPMRSVEGAQVEGDVEPPVVVVTCTFQRFRKAFRVAFDRDHKVAGFHYAPVPEDAEAKTRSLLAAASRGDFALASRDFGDAMKNSLPASALADAWQGVERQLGRWQAVEKVELKQESGLWTSLATLRFEHGRVVARVVYDAGDRVVGLWFQPISAEWQAPPYARPSDFEERRVEVGSAPALPGVLTVPSTPPPFPAVILVHGSGPGDEDETVGAVKVFKDLAWGLASRGIAVLRYVKRSRQAPNGVVTQRDEVILPAREAIEWMKRAAGVDRRRVFLLGHSQGGELAPRIAKETPDLAGIIVLAGPTRPMQDMLLEQYAYLLSLNPKSALLATKLDSAGRFKQTVEDPRLRADEDVDLPTGGTLKGAYFLDARGYDAPVAASALACRILVLQGERDYQVRMGDFETWRQTLHGKPGASFRSYPLLDHLFVAGVGASRPEDYQRPGHVDESVVRDIADWIVQTGP